MRKSPLVNGNFKSLRKVRRRPVMKLGSPDILRNANAEKYGYGINWHPKPLGDTDWNGSGMHANFF